MAKSDAERIEERREYQRNYYLAHKEEIAERKKRHDQQASKNPEWRARRNERSRINKKKYYDKLGANEYYRRWLATETPEQRERRLEKVRERSRTKGVAYKKENCVQLYPAFSTAREDDAKVLAHLDTLTNKTGYIRQLILEDIARSENLPIRCCIMIACPTLDEFAPIEYLIFEENAREEALAKAYEFGKTIEYYVETGIFDLPRKFTTQEGKECFSVEEIARELDREEKLNEYMVELLDAQ